MTILLHSKLGPAEVSALISICANACQPCAALITVINLDCRVGQSVRSLLCAHVLQSDEVMFLIAEGFAPPAP
jgi:hypothetical protein